MKTTLFIVLVSSVTFAAEVLPVCVPVAPVHKVHRKPKPKVEVNCPTTATEVVVVGQPSVLPTVFVPGCEAVVVVAPAPKKVVVSPDFLAGAHLALGLGARFPNSSGQFGIRLSYAPIHLGAEVYTGFDYGGGVNLLVYTVQGRLKHHIDLGVFGFEQNLKLSTQDVPRTYDVTVGTGLEYKLFKHVSATLDWRLAFPDPGFVFSHNRPVHDASGQQIYGQAGRYLDVGNVFKNSLSQSQVLVGILVN